MELTEKQKEFIGSKFPTRKGGELEVIGYHGKGLYLLTCSICHKDKELFPEPFKCSKGNLKDGKNPCACARCFYWSERQQIIRIEREIKGKDIIFEGFVGEFKGTSTRIKFFDPVNNFRWDTCKIGNLHSQGTGGLDKRNNNRDDSFHIQEFMDTGKYPEGSVFTKLGGDFKGYWSMFCPTCKETHVRWISCFKQGQIPCDCKQTASFNGYYEGRSNEYDHLYVVNFSNDYLKIGRTFQPDKRIYNRSDGLTYSSGYSKENLKIEYLYGGLHKDIWDFEQSLHSELKERGFHYTFEDWSTELFTIDCKYVLINMLQDYHKDFNCEFLYSNLDFEECNRIYK